MRKGFPLGLMLLAAGAIVFAVGFVSGSAHSGGKERRQFVYDEIRWTAKSLKEKNLSPQLREYLKAKLYYYSTYIHARTLRYLEVADYGPVAADVLGEVQPVPPYNASEFYESFKESHAKIQPE